MIPGVQIQEVVEALTEALSYDELAEMLRSRPDITCNEVGAGKLFPESVSSLLTWVIRQNQELALVHAAYRANSTL